MAFVDLGMEEDADAEAERLERERQARRAAAQAEAQRARADAGYDDAALDRALGGLQQPAAEPPARAPLPFQRNTAPFAPEEQARIGQVEQRLQAGDRAGVERAARAEQAGMSRPAVTAASPAPMAQRAQSTGSDPGMALPDPASARRAPPSFQLREQSWADAVDAEPWWMSGDEPPRPEARIEGAAERDAQLERMRPPPEAPPAARRAAPPQLRDPGFADRREPAKVETPLRPDQRLDAGLPTDRDTGDAGTRDDIRRPFRAIGRALQVAAGRNPGAMGPGEADTLRQRREAGMRERMAGKSAARAEDRQTRQDAAQADRYRMADERERQTLDLARVREERTARIADARQRMAEAQSEQERSEAVLELRRNDPASSESDRARRRYIAQAMARERALGAQGRSAVEVTSEVRDLSAADIEAMEDSLTNMTMGVRTSRAGSGGGRARDRSALFAEAESVGIPRAAAETMTDRELARSIEMRGRRSGDGEQGEMILPGVQAGPGLTSPGEARAMRHAFSQARAQMGALGEIERVAGQYGRSAAIDRRAAGELAAPVASLRAMVAQLQNTGVINPSEAPAIEAMLPNPQSLSQMTFGDLENRLRSFRGALERGIDSELLARGVDDNGRRSAIGMLRGGGGGSRSGGGAPQQAPQGDRVPVRRRDGQTGSVSRAVFERDQRQPSAQRQYSAVE